MRWLCSVCVAIVACSTPLSVAHAQWGTPHPIYQQQYIPADGCPDCGCASYGHHGCGLFAKFCENVRNCQGRAYSRPAYKCHRCGLGRKLGGIAGKCRRCHGVMLFQEDGIGCSGCGTTMPYPAAEGPIAPIPMNGTIIPQQPSVPTATPEPAKLPN